MIIEGPGHVSYEVTQPRRGQFEPNLSGAMQYTAASFVYKIIEVMGRGVGRFLAGIGLEFLEAIEPALVTYTSPLIDMMLEHEELDPHLRTFLTQLKFPTDEAAATLLAGLGTQAGGMLFNSVFGAALAPVTMRINQALRPSIPDVSAIMAMYRRGQIAEGGARELLALSGYKDEFIAGFFEISQQRAGFADWVEGFVRGHISEGALRAEATRQGIPAEVYNLLTANRRNLLPIDVMLAAMYRGDMTRAQLVSVMEQQGWATEDANRYVDAVKPLPGLTDAIHMAVREAWRDDVAGKWGYDADFPGQVAEHIEKLGLDPDWAKRYWRAHWELPSVTLMTEMVHRGIISPSEFDEGLKVGDFPAGWRERMRRVIYSPYTRVDARRMYGLGVLSRADVKRSYMDLGYDDEHAENLTEFTVRYEADDPDDKVVKYRNLTLSMLQSAYNKRLIGLAEFRARVAELRYPSEEIDLIVEITDAKRTVDDAVDYLPAYQKDVRSIVERAYYKGSISAQTVRSFLSEVGVTEEEVGYLLAANDLARTEAEREARVKIIGDAYKSRVISYNDAVGALGQLDLAATEQQRQLENWEAEISIGTRRLTEAQYRRAWGDKLITTEGYRDAMVALGYSADDVELLVAMTTGESGE